jgi:hypothetical protein
LDKGRTKGRNLPAILNQEEIHGGRITMKAQSADCRNKSVSFCCYLSARLGQFIDMQESFHGKCFGIGIYAPRGTGGFNLLHHLTIPETKSDTETRDCERFGEGMEDKKMRIPDIHKALVRVPKADECFVAEEDSLRVFYGF